MAGVMALVVQLTGEKQGNPNPVHYNLATQANIFHAITGNNAMPCSPGTPDCTDATGSDKVGVTTVQSGPLAGSLGYSTTTGFNLASGLGSMDVSNFVTNKAWTSALPADFSLSLPATPPTPTTVTVAAGGTATTTLTITGSGGYNGTINFTAASCSGLPAGNSCSFNPPSVGPGNGTTTITVTNTGSGMLSPANRQSTPGSQVSAGRLILLFSCFAVLWLGIQAARRRLRWSVVASLLVVGCLFGIAACGGGGSGGGGTHITPAVTNQTVVITATDGTNTHSIYFLFTVQ
jgi:hypothetical protein